MALPLQNFQDMITVVKSVWLNAVDTLVTTVFGQASTPAQARTNLTLDAPLEIVNGGTGTRSAQGILSILYPIVAAETTAGVTVFNYQYPPFTPERYAVSLGGDMYVAIQAANNAAAQIGASVNFLAGSLYPVNITANGPLIISTSWVCVGSGPSARIQRSDVGTQTANFMAEMIGLSDLTISGLEFDGQVTTTIAGSVPNQDLGLVGSYNDDATESKWSKAYGVRLAGTNNCKVVNCVFINFIRAGLRIDSEFTAPASVPGPPWTTGVVSLNNKVDRCWFIRNRGIYGDGFIYLDVEGLQVSNCVAYDYQRIGFVGDVSVGNYGDNGVEFVNCKAEFGHDAVTSGAQSNVGYWVEVAGDVMMTNCESMFTSVGFQMGSAANNSQGVTRPYTGEITLVNCHAIRCQSAGFKYEFANRDVHLTMKNCYAEVVNGVAPYSGSVGIGAMGYMLAFSPAAGGPNSLTGTAVQVDMSSCRVDMVNMSGVPTAAGVNVWMGNVTNPSQFVINIDKLSTKWLTNAGANDPNVQVSYENAALGYFGDIAFTGAANGGNRFAGNCNVTGGANSTTGYLMITGEISGANSTLRLFGVPCCVRAATVSNNGYLVVDGCPLFDWRGNPGFTLVQISNSSINDADPATNPLVNNRGSWGPGEFRLTNNYIGKQIALAMPAGTTTARTLCLTATGNEWYMQYPFSGGGEPALTLNLPVSAFGTINLNGNTFRNVGGKSSATGNIITCATGGTLQVFGAGNVYDSGYVGVASGQLIQYTNVPNFNNNPAVISAPFSTVNGGLQLLSVA